MNKIDTQSTKDMWITDPGVSCLLIKEQKVHPDQDELLQRPTVTGQIGQNRLLRLPSRRQKTLLPLLVILPPNGTKKLLLQKQEHHRLQEVIRLPIYIIDQFDLGQ